VNRATYAYQPLYCEENVYHLAAHPTLAGFEKKVAFVSNERLRVTMWYQRAARIAGEAVVWDYHVMLLAKAGTRWDVWDLDTTLDFPTCAHDYLHQTFGGRPSRHSLRPRFRLVDAGEFASIFASDRSHMRLADGRFRAPPPPWRPIGGPNAVTNLARFIDMTVPFVGEVIELDELRRRHPGDASV
jgi:hypothetical protein